MQKNLKKGFTLIELLVVIAIIGILAAIALTSLGSARDKAKDSSAQGSLSSLRASAEIVFDTTNSYDTVCDDGTGTVTDTERLLTAAGDANGGAVVCNDSATAYAAEVALSTGQFFCVDSDGQAGKAAATVGAATVCSL